MTDDPFDTEAVRQRVLAGWRAAAVRFREDANAEEDLALGGYRDRLVVELAQNAADAATRAGVPGRLLLRVCDLDDGPVLVAANTGAPLDAAGVEALATLRASAKRDEAATVGRFGVGFSAVLRVSDEPAVLSRHGGVRFSAADTRELVEQAAAAAPALAAELARRDGHVPVLRLPFTAAGAPPEGYDTAVVLPLRDAVAADLVCRLLDEVGDALLLALPALGEVTVERPGREPRTVRDVAARWHVVRRSGRFADELLADRPTEERARTTWSLTWALPSARFALPAEVALPAVVGLPAEVRAAPDELLAGSVLRAEQNLAQPAPAPVLHAPTPSDEPLPWPALLIAGFPLDPTRRHVAAGPATDALVREAASGYADLLAQVAADGRTPWDLVPVGLPAGVLDGALRTALADVLPGTAFLVAAEQPPEGSPVALLRPRDAVALDPPAGADAAVVAAFAPALAGLVLLPRAARPAADLVGVRRTTLGDVVEQLPAAGDPARWRALYATCTDIAVDEAGREALAALPVPLADGRVVRGARGLVLPGGPPAVALALATLGARCVHPDAAHPLLNRLGAATVTPRTALDLPAVRTATEAAAAALEDDDGPDLDADLDLGVGPDQRADRVADAVLAVVSAAVADAALAAGDVPWLGDLVLRDADGEPAPARELVLPGSVAAAVLDAGAVGVVAADLLDTWGRDVLVATGVLDGLAVVRAADVPLDPSPAGDGPLARLDGWAAWCDAARAAAPTLAQAPEVRVVDLVAIADLDVVDPAGWPALLAAVAADPALRAAVTGPATLIGDGHGAARVPSYPAWWLRRELAAAAPWADPAADPTVSALLPPGPVALQTVDPGLRAALGAVRDLDDLTDLAGLTGLDGAVVGTVLDRLADDDLDLDTATALHLWAVLAGVAGAGDLLDGSAAPELVRVLGDDDGPTRVVDASAAAVVGAPQYLQPGLLAAHGVSGAVVVVADRARREALADLLDVLLAEDVVRGAVAEDGAAAGEPAAVPAAVRTLLPQAPETWCEHDVLRVDGVEVDWWVERSPDVVVHACTLDGLARGLAAAAGAWSRRAGVVAVLEDPAALGAQLVDDAFGGAADL